MNAAIVGLVRGYDRIERYAKLIRRNRLLHRNFNRAHNYPVILFHEGNVPVEHQEIIGRLTPNITFVNVSGQAFVTPPLMPPEWQEHLGYKHMCRFYAVQVFEYVRSFDYIMRLDDDSFILSPIGHDVFERVEANDLDYGYIHYEEDYHQPTIATLPPFTRQYIRDTGGDVNCGLEAIDAFYFYTNFYVTRVQFWLRSQVDNFLRAVDRSLGIYQYRWGDHVIHTHALKMFSSPSRWHKFVDFRYAHGSHDWANYQRSSSMRLLQRKFRRLLRRLDTYYLRYLIATVRPTS